MILTGLACSTVIFIDPMKLLFIILIIFLAMPASRNPINPKHRERPSLRYYTRGIGLNNEKASAMPMGMSIFDQNMIITSIWDIIAQRISKLTYFVRTIFASVTEAANEHADTDV